MYPSMHWADTPVPYTPQADTSQADTPRVETAPWADTPTQTPPPIACWD